MPQGWPDVAYDHWRATCDTVHAHTQVLGKLAVALAPPEPIDPGDGLVGRVRPGRHSLLGRPRRTAVRRLPRPQLGRRAGGLRGLVARRRAPPDDGLLRLRPPRAGGVPPRRPVPGPVG